ncbi:cobalt chelatase [Pseudarthrobacter sp. AL07]|uniref:cobaltochelatase CobT-related protein n=1 Tax=unclassified Pseudarthrobacter TaxID=2647000 RepID=UPI00249AA09D|nr:MULTISPECIES: cobalt chelatase [unclassified Pseudarthrobacter]MDI3196305.1 cobalt chelatase [Pseudarthrobacter sp. AL20]MDI3210367.1 cobalt chelatase [Pseudarthrobacter sp. AL07]
MASLAEQTEQAENERAEAATRELAAASLRRRKQTTELCAAAMRALSGQSGLHFRGPALYRESAPVPMPAPHLHPGTDSTELEAFRGAADGMALRLQHSDAALHEKLCPATPARMLVFEMLEQFRTESLSDPAMPGVQANLNRRFQQWSREFEASTLAETDLGIILFTVAQVCRARITTEPISPDFEDRIESTRAELAPHVGTHLAALRRERFSQPRFAHHALAIAETVAAISEYLEAREARPSRSGSRTPQFQLLFDQDTSDDVLPTARYGRSDALQAGEGGYRRFTAAYDREFQATDLVRAELLPGYRQQLDDDIARQSINVPRLGRALGAVLSTAIHDGWDGDALEGRLDGSRLARLVTSSGDRRVFRTERNEPRSDATVTFLVDCSGSMKEHSAAVAALVDVYARALELAGARCEVLGFTTAAWNGGRAGKDWVRAGKPPHPGRLNEVRHLIFKDANTPWRRARPAIAALMKKDLFREGVDGEAVDWACARLNSSSGDSNSQGNGHERKILLVVSDGSPTDGATALANDGHYLEQHLQDVVAAHEAAGNAEIYGLGVGLDLSPYYRRNIALDLSRGSSAAVVGQVLAMLAGRR